MSKPLSLATRPAVNEYPASLSPLARDEHPGNAHTLCFRPLLAAERRIHRPLAATHRPVPKPLNKPRYADEVMAKLATCFEAGDAITTRKWAKETGCWPYAELGSFGRRPAGGGEQP